MTNEQHDLLNALSIALFNNQIETAEFAPVLLINEAAEQAVEGLILNLQISKIESDHSAMNNSSAPKCMDLFYQTISNNTRIFYNHSLLHDWMTEADIPYIILKGCASASYYPNPLLRCMGDVDFLVPTDYLSAAGQVLKEHGLKPWAQEHISHIVYRDIGMQFEMHFNVAGMPDGMAGSILSSYFSDIFEKAELKIVDDNQMILPSDFHHGLILLLHTCHHLTGEGIGLRHLCDWAVFENKFSNKEFRMMYEDKLKAVGLWHFAQILTQISIKYLGAEIREWAGTPEIVADRIMEDILSSGNFGRKDENRSQQTMLISDRGKNGVGQYGMIGQFVNSVNNIINLKLPSSRKHGFLLALGWFYYGSRYGIKILLRKRKTIFKRDVVNGARQRRELYKELKLYETE